MITRRQFNEGTFAHRNNNPSEHPVIKFLARNNGKAYTVKEISKYLRIKEDTIRGFMKTALAKKWVIHKTPYFIINLKK